MKKRTWYLIAVFTGVLLIIIPIIYLATPGSKAGQTNIWVQLVMMALYIALTISNFFSYRKELRKEKN
jgi:predicted permease